MRRTRLSSRAAAPLTAALLAATLLSGCGEDEPEVAADTPAATDAQEDVEDGAEEPVEEPLGEDDANEGAPVEVSAECQDAMVAAAAYQGAGPTEAEEPDGPLGEEPTATPDADVEPGGEFDIRAVIPAFEACSTVEEFAAALEDSPQALLGSDTNEPDEFVRLACEEEAVQGSTLCQSVQ